MALARRASAGDAAGVAASRRCSPTINCSVLSDSTCHWLTTVDRDAGNEQRPGETDYALAAPGTPFRGVTAREHSKFRIESEAEQFAGLQPAVFGCAPFPGTAPAAGASSSDRRR